MTNKFKPGDTVVCVMRSHELNEGQIYKIYISKMIRDEEYVVVDPNGKTIQTDGWCASRFEHYVEPTVNNDLFWSTIGKL